MKDQAHTPDPLQVAVGEIEMAMRVKLACNAIAGDVLREAVDAGHPLQEIADILSDYPAAMQTKIDLANRLNVLMKASGTGLAQALDALRKEGWLARLDTPDDMEPQS